MERQGRLSSAGDRRALPVVGLGVLVALVPLLSIRPPSEGGTVALAVRLAQTIAVVVGLAVASTGVYAYRTAQFRPAVAASTTVTGLTAVILVGGLIETMGGPLVPLWAWVVAGVAVVTASLLGTLRFVE